MKRLFLAAALVCAANQAYAADPHIASATVVSPADYEAMHRTYAFLCDSNIKAADAFEQDEACKFIGGVLLATATDELTRAREQDKIDRRNASGYRDPPQFTFALCTAPYRMTPSDGCK